MVNYDETPYQIPLKEYCVTEIDFANPDSASLLSQCADRYTMAFGAHDYGAHPIRISLERTGPVLTPPIRTATALAVLLAPGLLAAQPGTGAPTGQQPAAQSPEGGAQPSGGELQTFHQKLSYSLGLNAGRLLQKKDLHPDKALFIQGFKDSYKQGAVLLTDQEIQEIFAKVTQQMQAKIAAAQEKRAAEWNKAFSQPTAAPQTTASGLTYTVIKKGEGPKPKATDFVRVQYVGKFPSGEVFDSSLRTGRPAVFQLGGVIPGWTEGLQLMSPGAKYLFKVPAKLAYGAQGRDPVIPPNQDLVFEVELLDVMPANQAAGGAAGGNANAPPPQ